MQPALIGPAAAHQALAAAIDRHRRPPLALELERRGLGPYRGYGEMLLALRELTRAGAALEVIGKSVLDEPLFALTLGVKDAKRTSVLVSGIHPSEWIGIETHLALLERLTHKPPTDRRIVAIVVANPDGVCKVESNLRRGRRRFVRHNARGVDLNRNFPSYWGRFGLSRLLLWRVYRPGTRPASEPEVRAIVSFLKGAMVDRAVSFHSFGGMVLYPYGAMRRAPIDVDEHRRWACQIALRADPVRPYRAVQSARWVPGFTAPGMELDWFHDQHGALSLLIECSRGGVLERDHGGARRSRLARLRAALEPFSWFNPTRPERSAGGVVGAIEPFVRGASRPGL
jgi:hypothetical protein